MDKVDIFLNPTVQFPTGTDLETLYTTLAAYLNLYVKEQPKYKDLMNRILVAAMGNVAYVPVVAPVPVVAAKLAPPPKAAPDPRAAAAPKAAFKKPIFNIGISAEDAELKV